MLELWAGMGWRSATARVVARQGRAAAVQVHRLLLRRAGDRRRVARAARRAVRRSDARAPAPHTAADGALISTASHNPIEWNGFKCLDASGAAPQVEQANEIIQRFKVELKNSSQDGPRAVSTRHVPRRNDADEIHIQRVLKLIDIKAIRAAKLRVVVDSVNGSGCNAVRVMLQELGVHLEHLNGVVTGQFAHTR